MPAYNRGRNITPQDNFRLSSQLLRVIKLMKDEHVSTGLQMGRDLDEPDSSATRRFREIREWGWVRRKFGIIGTRVWHEGRRWYYQLKMGKHGKQLFEQRIEIEMQKQIAKEKAAEEKAEARRMKRK